MSRATNRPTHIPLPNSPFGGRSPNGSPLPTPAAVSPTSPRSSFIPNFIRTRSRAATLTGGGRGRSSPSAEVANPIGATSSQRPSPNNASNAGVTRSVSTPQSGGLAEAAMPPLSVAQSNPSNAAAINAAQPPRDPSGPPKTFRIRLVPHLETARSLAFDPVVRELLPIVVPPGINPSVVASSITDAGVALNGRPPALILKIGRFTEKPAQGSAAAASAAATAGSSTGGAGGSGGNSAIGVGPMSGAITIAGGGGDICAMRVAFKSKVVSRSHAEIWCEPGGKFFIRDTSSSSGTFLNHIRLSSPNTDSRPTQINDGDVLQLGVDYQGGHEDMYRCVKMRVELGREWQRGANEFNTNALRQLKALGGAPSTPDGKGKQADLAGALASSGKKKASVTDCCICLFSVTVCQSLFIAPCSHVFHYKCIRPLLQQHHPGFSCPLCRTFANLDEDVETEDAWELASRRASILSRKPSNHSIRIPSSDALGEMVQPEQDAGTGVDVGNGSASVEDLLSQPNGHDRDHEVEHDSPVPHRGDLEGLSLRDRQATVVPAESATAAAADGSNTMLPEETAAAIPISAQTNAFATSFSQAATPMNETFLSTLAPSVHQRLDLADQLDTSSQGHGSGVPETLLEESDSVMEESASGEGEGEGGGSGGPNTRRGSGPDEMVFELAGP